jgi:hypothetical protein
MAEKKAKEPTSSRTANEELMRDLEVAVQRGGEARR